MTKFKLKLWLDSPTFWGSTLAVFSTWTVFLAFLQGSRNPLKAFGVEIPEPRVIFWSCLTLLFVVVVRISTLKFFEKIRLSKKLLALLFLPLFLVFLRLIYIVVSGSEVSNLNELLALLGLLIASVIIGPMSNPAKIKYFWVLVITLFTIFLIISFIIGPKGPDQYFDAISVGRIMFARYMAIGAVVSLFFAFQHRQSWLYILGFCFVLGTFLAGSRGEVFALLVVGIITFVMMKNRLRLLFFSLVTSALLLFFTFGPWPFQVLRIRYVDLQFTYSAGRDKIWTEKAQTLKSDPTQLISGVPAAESSGSHNLFLDILLNGGIVILALTIIIFVSWFILVFNYRKSLGETALPVLIVILILVGSQFSGTFFENSLIWFFYILALLQIGINQQKRPMMALQTKNPTEP